MKKLFSVFMIAMIFCLSFASAEAAAGDAPWYELSEGNTVLTVRLPGSSEDGIEWTFEISNPDALELITQEEIEGTADSAATYVGSFMSTAGAENKVSLILRCGTQNPDEAPFATRVLELDVAADNSISVASVIERSRNADWIEYDEDNFILTVRIPARENGSQDWDMSLLNPEFFELITCDTENGYVGSFMSNLEGAGFTELSISNENITYTVDLFASEAGDLFVEWAEVFTVLVPGAAE